MSTLAQPPDTPTIGPLPDEAWIDPRPAIEVAIAALPTLADDDAADLLELLALTLVRLLEERQAIRLVLSASLTKSHELTVQIRRLEAQRGDLLTRMRSLRTNAEPCR